MSKQVLQRSAIKDSHLRDKGEVGEEEDDDDVDDDVENDNDDIDEEKLKRSPSSWLGGEMEICFLRLCGESEHGIPRIGRRTLFRAEETEEFSETEAEWAGISVEEAMVVLEVE